MQKRVLTVQDISCFGKCSITVALPVISAMGIETCIIPSAILSTHTGGFKGFTFRDLTEDIPKIGAHWQKENISFDCIYTGYIGDCRQFDEISEIKNAENNQNAVLVVDPVMADNGQLYFGFDMKFVERMRQFCSSADIIIPNITEASLLVGQPYSDKLDQKAVEKMLFDLSLLGAKSVVLTGISFNDNEIGAAVFDSATRKIEYAITTRLEGSYHGTGDVFASTVVGGLMRGLSLLGATQLAVDYTAECIRQTIPDKQRSWYGVKFETAIPFLLNQLSEKTASLPQNEK